MLDWITQHSDMLSLATNMTMVVIWLVYLQVFLAGFRRQTQPKIVINRAAGSGLDAACFVSNMSSDSIYLESVLTTVRAGSENWEQCVTDFEVIDERERPNDPRQRTHQGPLHPGDYTSIGSFQSLIERVTRTRKGPTPKDLLARDEPIEIEIMIIADHSSDDLLIGARRTFSIVRDDQGVTISPDTAHTRQIRSRRQRKAIQQIIMDQT